MSICHFSENEQRLAMEKRPACRTPWQMLDKAEEGGRCNWCQPDNPVPKLLSESKRF
jgi:hypothetical protein